MMMADDIYSHHQYLETTRSVRNWPFLSLISNSFTISLISFVVAGYRAPLKSSFGISHQEHHASLRRIAPLLSYLTAKEEERTRIRDRPQWFSRWLTSCCSSDRRVWDDSNDTEWPRAWSPPVEAARTQRTSAGACWSKVRRATCTAATAPGRIQ